MSFVNLSLYSTVYIFLHAMKNPPRICPFPSPVHNIGKWRSSSSSDSIINAWCLSSLVPYIYYMHIGPLVLISSHGIVIMALTLKFSYLAMALLSLALALALALEFSSFKSQSMWHRVSQSRFLRLVANHIESWCSIPQMIDQCKVDIGW